MIKNKALLGLLFFIGSLFTSYSCSKDNDTENDNSKTKTARVVGYLSTDNFEKMSSVQFCKLTHLNLSFANPDNLGNLIFDGDIDAVIAHVKGINPNIKISVSVAGGVISAEQAANWSLLIDKPENRPAFIKKIIDFVELHKLDGVDVDLEWDAVTTGYSGFVVELKNAIKSKNKLITAALPNNTRFVNIKNEALNAFDFINIMAYDMTGPWAPDKPGQHSAFNDAKLGIEFWNKMQNVPKEKLTLGVPFYGYNFTDPVATSVTYGQMVAVGNQFAELDELGKIYYNGRPTIEQKVQLASETTGGIMIWEIAQDSFDQYSLLDVIHKKYTKLGFVTTDLCGN
ncbi:glycosyl hydrolase family 18 protein [Flavobacterium hibisci]|uniref:glycosyl hydrolase family 18 protein n=1 Tax=Flavobacterium hibisci TaxID=1914462 RepID=UPI001CC0E5B2|nr:glycosyl hydrolase family 18 protein [Flavobacterium hibisci]MBZ4042172.1 glycoside hydrolase [Flavobacterium hibisci]